MKKTLLLALGLSVLASTSAKADLDLPFTGATLTFTAFNVVTDGVFKDLPSTYYCVLNDGTQTSATHVVVGPLQLVSTDAKIYAGDYSMVNSSTGEDLADGAIAFQMESADTVDGTYPIVGVIPLAGGWGNASISTSTMSSSDLGGKTASVSYNTQDGAIEARIGADAYSYLNYIAKNSSSVEIEAPFWIAPESSVSVKFVEGFLDIQDDKTIKGIIHTDFSEASIKNSVYMITLTDSNDSDSDGFCDLFDQSNYWYADCDVDNNGLVTSSWLGDFWFYYGPRWSGSNAGFDASLHSTIWHPYHGYLYTETFKAASDTKWAFFYDYNLGWLATNEASYPYMYAYDAKVSGSTYGATWLYYKEGTGSTNSRYFYAFSGTMRTSSNTGYNGWWAIEGAN